MPAAYTHVYITHVILSRLGQRSRNAGGTFDELTLDSVDGSGRAYPVRIHRELAGILEGHQEWFRGGAIAPDFVPDPYGGILASHQADRRGKTLADFMSVFGSSAPLSREQDVAFAFGWLSHVCADVFGHDWVGLESGGDFQTWLSTPPEVIRKHLGIEVLWNVHLPEVDHSFRFDPTWIRRLTLDPGSPLRDTFYRDEAYAELTIMTEVLRLAVWHRQRVERVEAFRQQIPLPGLRETLERLCPACNATGIVEEVLDAVPCAVCVGQGLKEATCVQCKATGRFCPTCATVGYVRRKVPDCPACGGSGRRRCEVCLGRGKLGFLLPCPRCGGRKKVTCRHPFNILTKVLTEACPKCRGEEVRRKVCPQCKGAKLIRKHCPACRGEKVVREVRKNTCPCRTATPFSLLDLICQRLQTYHERRAKVCDELVDSYVAAHGDFARALLADDTGNLTAVYDGFGGAIAKFLQRYTSFSDLVSEDLQDATEQLRELVSRVVPAELKKLEPEWLVDLKAHLFDEAMSTVLKQLGLTLTEAETSRYRGIWPASEFGATFPPLANAVVLFLRALDQCEPTSVGLARAAAQLGRVDNIDKRCQPYRLAAEQDPAFPAAAFFLPPVDPAMSLAQCGPRPVL